MVEEDPAGSGTAAARALRRIAGGFWSLMSRPEYLVVILGLIFGLLILILTPPFQACDEPNHIYNAYRISEGNILPQMHKGKWGNYIPRGFYETYGASRAWQMIHSPQGKEDAHTLAQCFNITLKTNYKPFMASYIQYPPLCYAPQAVAMAIGRMFRGPPILLIYLARLFNLLAVLVIAFVTIRTTPVLRWTFFLLFLMPMTLFQSSSCSADALTIAFCFLTAAFFFKIAFDPAKESVGRRDLCLLLALSIALGLIKLPYFLLLFGFFLIPWRRFGSKKKYVITFGLMFALAAVLAIVWQFVILKNASVAPSVSVAPTTVLAEMFHHPLSFLRLEYHRLFSRGLYVRETVAGVGWWNVVQPGWLAPLFAVSIVGVALLDKESPVIKRWQRGLSFAVFLVLSAMIIVILHITMDPLRAAFPTAQDWINGRYFIPPLAFGFLVFYNKRIPFKKGKAFYLAVTALAILFCVTTVVMIFQRFY